MLSKKLPLELFRERDNKKPYIKIPTEHLRDPKYTRYVWFRYGSGIDTISKGRDGFVVKISDTMVVKIPLWYMDGWDAVEPTEDDTVVFFQHEAAIYTRFNEALDGRGSNGAHASQAQPSPPPPPVFLQCFLSIEDAVFFPLMTEDVSAYLKRGGQPTDAEKQRWPLQIAAAARWLETAWDMFHCDLRLPNVLLDADHNIKVADFGNATPRGHEFLNTTPFYMMDIAGPASEQFAVSGCIYAILTGKEPWQDMEMAEVPEEDQHHRLMRGEFPPIDGLGPLASVIDDGWHARYDSMAAMYDAILTALVGSSSSAETRAATEAALMNNAEWIPQDFCEQRAVECRDWMAKGIVKQEIYDKARRERKERKAAERQEKERQEKERQEKERQENDRGEKDQEEKDHEIESTTKSAP